MKRITILTFLAVAGCVGTKNQPAAATHNNTPSMKNPSKAVTLISSSIAGPMKVLCTKGSETRSLDVVKKRSGCALDYEKYGKTLAVASSSHALKHCQESQNKIKSKLAQAGFKCE